MHHRLSTLILSAAALLLSLPAVPAATEPADSSGLAALRQAIVADYERIVRASYEDSLTSARTLGAAIDTFLQSPTEAALARARQAWLDARVPYAQTEAYRFYDGPIEALEGRINAWPIDENLIDYVDGEPGAGIINRTAEFPDVTTDVIVSLNEKDGEKNITAGFHAIEFLLWGQDLRDEGPGERSHLDYVDGHAPNAGRRREYLRLVTRLLIDDLAHVTGEWEPAVRGNYRARLEAMPSEEALALVLKGIGVLSAAELAGERLTVPYETKDQEDEHSCFSDNTHRDLLWDAVGIQNVFEGRYVRTDGERIGGRGLRDLLARIEPALADDLGKKIDESVALARALPPPFDQAIVGKDTAPGRIAVKRLIVALRAQGDTIARAGAVLGVPLNF